MPTPSVAFNLTCAFNPGSAKLLFNVEEHGVFRVTCEKCISNMQSKSDSVLFCGFFKGKRNKATPQQRGVKPIHCFDTSVTSGHSGGHLLQAVMMCVIVGVQWCD